MKVKYIGHYFGVYLENGGIYDAELKDGMYSIYSEYDEASYLYDPQYFEIVEDDESHNDDVE